MTAHTPSGAALTELVLETFRLNGRLIAAGDRLTAPFGLTSARWQVLGAVAMAERPGPVPAVARAMGLTRQSVQRIVGELVAEGLLRLAPNPGHKRAHLVLLADAGRRAYDAATAVQAPWANALAEGIVPEALHAAAALLRRVRTALEDQAGEDQAGEDQAGGSAVRQT